MVRSFFIAFAFLFLAPFVVQAAPVSSFSAARSLLIASTSPNNTYAAGTTVTVTAPTKGDLLIAGGSVILASPVGGDTFLIGGSVEDRGAVAGDVRAIGGSVSVDKPVQGDLVVLGFSVYNSAPAKGSVFIIAANANITGGAGGPVTIYANNITLSGHFASNIHIVSSGRITLVASTTVNGSLTYEAPEEASIPDSVVISKGIQYTNASYLPSVGTSRTLAFISIGIFLLARILGALILAGLFAGLFPRLAFAVAERAEDTRRIRTILLTILLGFATLVATPVFLFLLALTFIGFGISLLLFIAYGLLVTLAFIYAGILVGTLITRRLEQRRVVFWRDGVLGMFILSLIALIPYIGMFILALFMAFTAGALLHLFFQFSFPHEETTNLL